MPTPEQLAWLQKHLKINVKHAEVETSDNPFGFTEKAKGAEYEGEHEKMGWRNKTAPDATREVTRKYNEEERAAHTLKVDDDGIVRDSTGKPSGETDYDASIYDKTQGYAMDPKTGEMVTFEGNVAERALNADGTPGDIVGESVPGQLNAKRVDIRNRALGRGGVEKENIRAELGHHTTPLGGEDVASAGYVTTSEGKVTSISNISGHYKPQYVHLLQAVEHLMSQGAMLNTNVIDADGWALDDDDPEFKLYKKLAPRLKTLPALRVKLQKTLDALGQDDLDGEDAAALERESKDLKKQVDVLSKGMQMLAKLGVGKAMSKTGATVQTYKASEGMDGPGVHDAEKTTMDAQEFMKGAANPEQLAAKEAMHAELELGGRETPLRPEDRDGGEESIHEMPDGEVRDSPDEDDMDAINRELDELYSEDAGERGGQDGSGSVDREAQVDEAGGGYVTEDFDLDGAVYFTDDSGTGGGYATDDLDLDAAAYFTEAGETGGGNPGAPETAATGSQAGSEASTGDALKRSRLKLGRMREFDGDGFDPAALDPDADRPERDGKIKALREQHEKLCKNAGAVLAKFEAAAAKVKDGSAGDAHRQKIADGCDKVIKALALNRAKIVKDLKALV